MNSMERFFRPSFRLVERAFAICAKRGYPDAWFRWSDLGDVYHVYGVSAKPRHLADIMCRRIENKT